MSSTSAYTYPGALIYQFDKNDIYNIWYRFRCTDPDSVRMFGLPAPCATEEENASFVNAMMGPLPKHLRKLEQQLTIVFRDFITNPDKTIMIMDHDDIHTLWRNDDGLRGGENVPWKLPELSANLLTGPIKTLVTLVDKDWKPFVV